MQYLCTVPTTVYSKNHSSIYFNSVRISHIVETQSITIREFYKMSIIKLVAIKTRPIKSNHKLIRWVERDEFIIFSARFSFSLEKASIDCKLLEGNFFFVSLSTSLAFYRDPYSQKKSHHTSNSPRSTCLIYGGVPVNYPLKREFIAFTGSFFPIFCSASIWFYKMLKGWSKPSMRREFVFSFSLFLPQSCLTESFFENKCTHE